MFEPVVENDVIDDVSIRSAVRTFAISASIVGCEEEIIGRNLQYIIVNC